MKKRIMLKPLSIFVEISLSIVLLLSAYFLYNFHIYLKNREQPTFSYRIEETYGFGFPERKKKEFIISLGEMPKTVNELQEDVESLAIHLSKSENIDVILIWVKASPIVDVGFGQSLANVYYAADGKGMSGDPTGKDWKRWDITLVKEIPTPRQLNFLEAYEALSPGFTGTAGEQINAAAKAVGLPLLPEEESGDWSAPSPTLPDEATPWLEMVTARRE